MPGSASGYGSSAVKTTTQSKFQLAAATKPVDEAVAIYEKRYPPRGNYKVPFYNSWGIPKTDIDGSSTSTKVSPQNEGKRIFDQDSKVTRATFLELAKVYGAEEALQMTKDLPSILAFEKANFRPSFVEFGKIFGTQEAKEMVMRNPGLLAVKPVDAANSDDQTMQFSYIVAKTRPIGGVLLYGTFGLLSIPVLEGISGVPFRANLLQSILN